MIELFTNCGDILSCIVQRLHVIDLQMLRLTCKYFRASVAGENTLYSAICEARGPNYANALIDEGLIGKPAQLFIDLWLRLASGAISPVGLSFTGLRIAVDYYARIGRRDKIEELGFDPSPSNVGAIAAAYARENGMKIDITDARAPILRTQEEMVYSVIESLPGKLLLFDGERQIRDLNLRDNTALYAANKEGHEYLREYLSASGRGKLDKYANLRKSIYCKSALEQVKGELVSMAELGSLGLLSDSRCSREYLTKLRIDNVFCYTVKVERMDALEYLIGICDTTYSFGDIKTCYTYAYCAIRNGVGFDLMSSEVVFAIVDAKSQSAAKRALEMNRHFVMGVLSDAVEAGNYPSRVITWIKDAERG